MNSFFSRHTRRRASPRPAEDDRGNDDLNNSFTTPNNRRRRRQLNDIEGASLLPLTYQQQSSGGRKSSSKRHSSPLLVTKSTTNSNVSRHYGAAGGLPLMAPGSSTCNSFLMGGHYYPGKDKKRKQYFQRRRNTCWHRVFCSSLWRMVGSTIVIAYLMVWHVVLPATDIVLDYGRFWSGPSHEGRHELRLHRTRRHRRKPMDDLHGTIEWLLHDATLHLPSLLQRRDELEKMQAEHERLKYGSEERFKLRKAIWEDIVPGWYHRNDPNESHHHSSSDAATPQEDSNQQEGVAVGDGHKEGNGETDKEQEQQRLYQKQELPDNSTEGKEAAQDFGLVPEGHQNGKDESERRRIEVIDVAHSADQGQTPRRRLRTLENMNEFSNQTSCPMTLSPDNIATTLVIQSSLERMWILETTCQRWKGPMVVVLWLPSNHTTSTWSPPVPCPQMKLISYHAAPDEDLRSYPVNHLRNLGLEEVETSHVLVADVDFVPSLHLHEEIQSVLQAERQHQIMNITAAAAHVERERRQAVVVPAFERLLSSPCNSTEDCQEYLKQDPTFLPRTFSELQDCVASNKCSVFQSQVNWEGHYSTRSEAWLAGDWYDMNVTDATTAVKRIKSIHCFDSLRYEPYVVLRWCPAVSGTTTTGGSAETGSNSAETANNPPAQHPVAPFYDERFYGYGKNKIEMISHLRFMGYRFAILPRGFLIHHPHPESVAKDSWNRQLPVATNRHRDRKANVDLHEEMDQLYAEFLAALATKYQHQMHEMIRPCTSRS